MLAGPVLDPAYGAEVARRVAALPDLARSLGMIETRAMAAAYRGADVVLNTSLSEGFANALAEAKLAGRPVLASDVAGNRAAVANGVDGLLYRLGDERDFFEKARLLASDAALRTRLGDAARGRAERELSPRREADAIAAAYSAAAATGV
jgi:glycosyltransferase involved in cell wall biosynthesis